MENQSLESLDGKDNQINSEGQPAEREATKRIDADMDKMC